MSSGVQNVNSLPSISQYPTNILFEAMDANNLHLYRKGENVFTQSERLVQKIAQEYYSLVKLESPSNYALNRIEEILELAINNTDLSDLIDRVDQKIAYEMDLLVNDDLEMTNDFNSGRETPLSTLWEHDCIEENKFSSKNQTQEDSGSNLVVLPLSQHRVLQTQKQPINKRDIKLAMSGAAVGGALIFVGFHVFSSCNCSSQRPTISSFFLPSKVHVVQSVTIIFEEKKQPATDKFTTRPSPIQMRIGQIINGYLSKKTEMTPKKIAIQPQFTNLSNVPLRQADFFSSVMITSNSKDGNNINCNLDIQSANNNIQKYYSLVISELRNFPFSKQSRSMQLKLKAENLHQEAERQQLLAERQQLLAERQQHLAESQNRYDLARNWHKKAERSLAESLEWLCLAQESLAVANY
jgi:hypothetical protein